MRENTSCSVAVTETALAGVPRLLYKMPQKMNRIKHYMQIYFIMLPFKNNSLTLHRKKQLRGLMYLTSILALILIVHTGLTMRIREQTQLLSPDTDLIQIKPTTEAQPKSSDNQVLCHYIQSNDTLPDISDIKIKKGQSIFFHETSCTSITNGKISINSRQACAVESAAKMNPDREIYLLYASPGKFLFENSESDRFLMELMKYPNINLYYLNMDRYFTGSPVENLWKEKKMMNSHWAMSHTSDVLRYLTLWNYGGIYLDLDVIVTKNFDDLGTDFTGVESDTDAAAGILGFSATGKGHEYVSSCLEDLKNTFNGRIWGWNGPGTVTRFIKRLCGVNGTEEVVGKTCEEFKIYPASEFYAVPYWDWEFFFDPKSLESVRKLTNGSHIIHVWNKLSSTHKIPLDAERVPYLEYAKQYCPHIVAQCDEDF